MDLDYFLQKRLVLTGLLALALASKDEKIDLPREEFKTFLMAELEELNMLQEFFTNKQEVIN